MFSKFKKSENFYYLFNFGIRFILIIAIIASIFEKNWFFVFSSALTLLLTFFPRIVERRYKIELPISIQVVIILFIYSGIFLGGVGNFYVKFWWWDSLLHFLAGTGLGFIGFLILYVLYKKRKIDASAGTIVFLSFCFALSMGALWEIFEFLMDSFYGSDMQFTRKFCPKKGPCGPQLGVIDTMLDLILDSAGALIASLGGYFYLKTGEFPILKNLIKKFEEKNPRLFK